MERSLVLGIDVGSAKVAVVAAVPTGDRPRIVGVGVAPCTGMRKGRVTELGAVAAAISEAADRALATAGRPAFTAKVVVGVSGPHVRSLIGTAEAAVRHPALGVAEEEVRRLMAEAARVERPPEWEVIHVLPRGFRLDGAEGVIDPVGLVGRTLTVEAHLICGDSLSVQNVLKAAVAGNLPVTDYLVNVRAAGEAVLTREEREQGVLLLEIGAGTTSVGIYDHGHLWHVGVLPVGGEHITNDLATVLHLPVVQAEQMKIAHGWAAPDLAPYEAVLPLGGTEGDGDLSAKHVAAIIGSRVEEMLELVAREIKRSGYTGLFPAGVVLTGGSARLQGLPAVVNDCYGLPCRVGVPAEPLLNGPEFAAAAGLVGWASHLAAEDAVAATSEPSPGGWWSRVVEWFRGLFG